MIFSCIKVRSCLLFAILMLGVVSTQAQDDNQEALIELGRSLFFDTNFSAARNISCATCHDPARGFVDARNTPALAALSLGSDGQSLGLRNAPAIAYLGDVPDFAMNEEQQYIGGFFHDGRAENLAAQAAMPVLDPKEMAIADETQFLQRLLEDQTHVTVFRTLFGADSIEQEVRAIEGFGEAIAAFERSESFSPFDSKYDRYLLGQYTPTAQEQVGMALFFTPGFTSCNECHQLQSLPSAINESFSNNLYENIGVPANRALVLSGELERGWVDEGLAASEALLAVSAQERDAQRGKFKVPTLRNIALTAPYMHNGVFKELRTVLKFYNKYNAVTIESQTNPETGQLWEAPEVPENIDEDKLVSLFLTDRQIDALMAFLLMLTDQRYEHLQ